MEDTRIFNQQIPTDNIPRNFFKLGNWSMATVRAGELVPVYCQELMPDTRTQEIRDEIYGRLMPLINPIYGRMKLYTYHFFVPTRIMYPHFDRFRANKKVKTLDSASYVPIDARCELFPLAMASCYGYLRNMFRNSGYSALHSLNYVGLWTNSLPDYLNMPSTNEVSPETDLLPYTFDNEHPVRPCTLVDNPLVNIMEEGQSYAYWSVGTGSDENPTVFSYLNYKPNTAEIQSQGNRLVFIEPFIGYTLIWYDYFRDWRLEDYDYSPYDFIKEVSEHHQNNYSSFFSDLHWITKNEQLNWFTVRSRCFTSDMFISAFPTPQLGDAMNLPAFSDFMLDVRTFIPSGQSTQLINFTRTQDSTVPLGSQTLQSSDVANLRFSMINPQGPSIDSVRQAEQLQKYYQMLMVHGINQRQLDKQFYGVESSLPFDNPIYLGGQSWDFQISEVIQTSASQDDSPLGEYAGRASVNMVDKIRNFTTDEFGYYYVIACIVPEQAYFQGMPRQYTRRWDITEWPNHMFANLGFDSIANEELFFEVESPNGLHAREAYETNKRDFGYMTRYITHRIHNNEVHGNFRSTLLNYHNSRFFFHVPPLNQYFTNVDWKSFERVFAVHNYSSPNIVLYIKNTFDCTAPLQYYCNPF